MKTRAGEFWREHYRSLSDAGGGCHGAGIERDGRQIVHGFCLVIDATTVFQTRWHRHPDRQEKRDEVMSWSMSPATSSRRAGPSAHAQVCDLGDEQIANHRSMMRREEARGKWTPQQMVYISQLHLTTVMLLTGKIKLVEKQGDKEVVVEEEKKGPVQTCSEEQRKKVKELITAACSLAPAYAEGCGRGSWHHNRFDRQAADRCRGPCRPRSQEITAPEPCQEVGRGARTPGYQTSSSRAVFSARVAFAHPWRGEAQAILACPEVLGLSVWLPDDGSPGQRRGRFPARRPALAGRCNP